jgi:uncharacterized iron-regulated membrane protein
VVLIVSITGCLFVFQKEITERLHKEWYFVKPAAAAGKPGVHPAPLPLSQLQQKAQQVLGPEQPIQNITIYRQPDRTWEFMAYRINDTALTYFGAIDYYRAVYLDPYTGAVTGIRDYKYDFFSVVKYIHWSLLLNTRYGQPIVGWSTLIFVLLLVTGLVLWWPKKWSRKFRDRSFKIKWKASSRRVNYDLHNVPGFYILLPALILALTGLVFSFKWFSALVCLLASGSPTPPSPVVARSQPPDSAVVRIAPTLPALVSLAETPSPLDKAFRLAQEGLPSARRLSVTPASGKEGVIYVLGYQDGETYYGADALQFDPYSGRLLQVRKNKEKSRGERLVEMNYDIHVGAIGGLTGKIMAFIISLICASLPVTGFLIWMGRGKKRLLTTGRPIIKSSEMII